MSKPTFTFTTDDPALAAQALAMFSGGKATALVATALVATAPAPAPVPAAPAPAPVATPPAPAPVATPPAPPTAPAPAPAPAAAPAAQPQGEAPPGWTIAHVTGALQALGANAAKGGPAAVAALLTKYGAKSVTGINPALWPQVYADATAA